MQVTTSGNEVFFRNVRKADENVFVVLSSPSSSSFRSVQDLGEPSEAARTVDKQLLNEFMSTRLGVRRELDSVKAEARTGMGAIPSTGQ